MESILPGDDPTKVEVVSPVPIPVSLQDTVSPVPVTIKGGNTTNKPQQNQETDPSVAARTTFQQDLTLLGQREINLIWEKTQSLIALGVVFFTMGISAYCAIKKLEIPALVAMAFGTVVGFYFSRTNHAAIGGIGPKNDETKQEYKGR